MRRQLVLLAFLAGCGDELPGGPADGAPPSPIDAGLLDATPVDESAVVFAMDRVHEIALEVAPADLAELRPDNDVRVPCTLTFDGETITGAGVRLKGGFGSVQTLDGKPGFSVKVNEVVAENRLHGLTKIVLNNAVQDPSFLSEHVGFEIFRRAGVPATRTAYAQVTLNGEDYGVYVLVEAKDRRFVERWYADASGNLYEGSFAADVIDPAALDLDTNEEVNDRSDAQALAAAVLAATPDDILARAESVVDLDEFITFWAVEALTYHWDGYALSPNNYHLYHEPARGKFTFIPHGADQLFQSLDFPVDTYPQARLASALADCGCVKDWYLYAVERVLDEAWDVPALTARIDEARALIVDAVHADPRKPYPNFWVDQRMDDVRAYVADRPTVVRAALP